MISILKVFIVRHGLSWLSSVALTLITLYILNRPLEVYISLISVTINTPMLLGLWTGLGAFSIAWYTSRFIIRHSHLHDGFTTDYPDKGPQRFHIDPTPRIGGLSLLMALIGVIVLLMGVNLLLEQRIQPALISLILLLLAGLPAFLAGFLDDVTKVMKVMDRLLLTAVSAVLSIAVLGAVVPRIDISALDVYFQFSLVAIFFTVVAVVGVSNAMNIIDGYHGLASGVGLIITLAFATISYVHSDAFLLITCLALLGALLGFLIWNWPKGYLFLGDGGAYLLGFILAQVGILLVIRHPDISPWFPLTLIIYPVFETLFSIVRRLGKNHSPGHADNLHLHQLVFRYEQDCHREKGLQYHNGLCNPKVAKYFWIATLLNASIAMPWSGHTPVMMVLVGINALGYVLTYRWLSKRYLAQSN